MSSPTQKEIEAAFKEEHDAALDFARLLKDEQSIKLTKEQSRSRLMKAREEKRALLNDLMGF